MERVTLSSINQYVSATVNPADTPEDLFELYSVPSYENQYPEIVKGKEIGSTKAVVQEGDVLICKINPKINRVWVVKHNTEYPLLASSEWIVVRNSAINSDYLKWYFMSPFFRKLLTSQVAGIGGSLTRAQPKQVAKYPVPMVELGKQEEIVNLLEKVNFVISARQQQLTKFDELVKARFVEMFGDPLSSDKGWPRVAITDVCDAIYGGGTPSKSCPEYFNGRIPWVTPKDMKILVITDSVDHITEEAIANSSANLVPPNSVLMVIRSGILKHTLPVAINSVSITINQDMKAFVPNQTVTAEFLLHFFKAIEADILSGVRAVTADNIDFKAFQKRKIVVPPLELQNQFTIFIKQVDKSRLYIQKSLEQMEILKKALMQKYFG